MRGRTQIDGGRVFGLDPIRAFAIGSVLYAHCASVINDAGRFILPIWVDGVEVFFVLSGFLIGGLLIEIAEREPSLRSWRTFMVRRWMRTVPAYLVVFGLLMETWPPRYDVALHALEYLTFTQNLAWSMPHGNWLAVSWSLTVEEWFYLLFSAAYLLAACTLGKRGQWLVLALFLIFPVLARAEVPVALPFDENVRKVALLRMDAIAYGVLLARLHLDAPALFDRWKAALCLGLLVIIASSWLDVDHGGLARSLSPCITSVGWALCFPAVLRVARPGGIAGNFVVALSEQSYVIYLTHYTLLEYFTLKSALRQLNWAFVIPAALIMTWVVSWLSLRLFERPILARRPKQWTARWSAPALAAVPVSPP